MPGINQATVGDAYTAAATVQDVFTSTGGWFSVASQPVVLQLQWGPNASGSRWSDEQTLGAGAFGTIPAGCTGIRFRNLVAGKAANVTAYIGAGGPPPDPRGNVWPEPALAISALGSVTTSGTAPTQSIITASGTYNTPAGCVAILVECIGGGGGGAGVGGSAGNIDVGVGGNGGSRSVSLISSPAASYTVTIGGAGAGGPNGGGVGGNGGDTIFGAGSTVVAKGGIGGTEFGAGVTIFFLWGAPNAAGTGTVQQGGGLGAGFRSANGGASKGGDAPGGDPGARTNSVGATAPGVQPTGFGGGGSGGVAVGATNSFGGQGAPGIIRVTEFY